MALKDLLKPTKEKISADLALVIGLLVSMLLVPSLGYQKSFLSSGPVLQIISIVSSLLAGLLLYYPLVCGIIFIYGRIAKTGKEKPGKNDLAAAVLMVLVFNPLSLSLASSGLSYANNNVIHTPCGVEIAGFAQASPARDAGAGIGETITAVDGNPVDTGQALLHYVQDKKPGDAVSIDTNARKYNFQMAENPETKRATLGVLIKDRYCKR